jgi:hypothetical protein
MQMAAGSMSEVIREILESMDAVADHPCVNPDCADRDGKCARKGCGGYMGGE